jgi:lipopolysaccharide/colanic/teichoic acid biosynthesis glycosyltransferase
LLVLASPILILAALAVLLFSGVPILYGHVRVGRDGKAFRCWKLRTMAADAEERLNGDALLRRRYVKNGYKLGDDDDPRVTRVGRLIRRTYIDELPQLVNVLNGTMSLVGPRPVIEEELSEFEPNTRELLSLRPGIFGAWTSRGRERPPYPERAHIEIDYVRARSIRTDASILLRSLPVVLRGQRPGA